MGLNLDKIDFDPSTPTESSRIGSYIIGQGGTVATITTIGGIEALDVNIAGSSGLGIYAEASAATTGELGQPALAVDENGDYRWLKLLGDELQVKDADVLAQLVLINSDTTAILADTATIDSNLASLVKAEDAAHSSGDNGIMSLGVRKDVPTALAGADGDYATYETDARGRMWVNDTHNIAWQVSTSTVGTSAVQLMASPLASRKRIFVQNKGSSSIYVRQDNTVTTSNGIEIPKNASWEFDLGPAVSVYAISGSAGQDVRCIEAA